MEVGDVVAVMKPGGLVKHFGVLVGEDLLGNPVVVSASGQHGQVVSQTLAEFCGGQPPERYRVPSRRLPDADVTWRALRAVGTPYKLFQTNCEHFVRHVHGFPAESPQVLAWFALVGSAAIALGAGALNRDL